MSLFLCPICAKPLARGEKTYRCPEGHSYDRSAAGYVYLLPVNQKHSQAPGDDPQMAAARRAFLSAGYFHLLLDALCQLSVEYTNPSPAVLDAGCGEGYYTAGVYRALAEAGKSPRMAGTDISKFILKSAPKREPEVEFAVASSYRLPLADGSADLLLDCFSPLALTEFRRVLRPGGVFLYVVPAAFHLWELKQALYDTPYPNEEKETPYEGFSYEKIVPVEGTITLRSQEEIQNLFRMTPYFWKTSRENAAHLAGLETLTTRISFRIHVFRRTGEEKLPE